MFGFISKKKLLKLISDIEKDYISIYEYSLRTKDEEARSRALIQMGVIKRIKELLEES